MSWILQEIVFDRDVVLTEAYAGLGIRRGTCEVVVEPPWGPLLSIFRSPHKIVDAVVEFCEERGLDADRTLDEVFPIFERLLVAGILRPAPPSRIPEADAVDAGAGRRFVDAVISALPAARELPKASLTFGAAGLAYALWHMARTRRDKGLLEQADAWLRAARPGPDEAWESPYHGRAAVPAVGALVAHARRALGRRDAAVMAFVEASSRRCTHVDLTLGQAGVLAGAAILLAETGSSAELLGLGREKARCIGRRLEQLPPIREQSEIGYLGMAHGWGGLLYALLAWSQVSREAAPAWSEERLAQLAELGEPHGKGLRWPRLLASDEAPRYLPSWCNGAAGLVHLWLLAHRTYGGERYLELAERSGWNAWSDGDASISHLCCGLAGRAYGLLALYKTTGQAAWLGRARRLAAAAMEAGSADELSLYKGRLGVAVLLADLEEPESASMPFFEIAAQGTWVV